MSKKEVTAVYIVENLITGKVYIGNSQNFNQRRLSHLYTMRGSPNCKTNQRSELKRDYTKYGQAAFSIKVIKRFYGEMAYHDSHDFERLMIYFFFNSELPIYNEDIFRFAKKWNNLDVDNFYLTCV